MPSSGTAQTIGKAAEQQALSYLAQQGLELLQCNYRCRRGEIDLIMQHQNTLVFVEVRKRGSRHFGSAQESVTAQKQQRLLYAAQHYLACHANTANQPCRFDVIAINGKQQEEKIQWIQNAFQA